FAGRFLLRDAVFYLGEFFLDFGHFVGFELGRQCPMPFRKRLLPLRRGEIFATRAEVDVAEMAVNGGVVTLALDCLAEESLGLDKLISFITDPAEAIEIGSIVRLFVESALQQGSGFVQAGRRTR